MQNTDLIRRYVMLPGGALIDIHLDLIDQGGAVDLIVLLHNKEVAPLQGGFRRGPDGVYARQPAGGDEAAAFGLMGVVIEPDDAGKVKDHCSSDIHAGHSNRTQVLESHLTVVLEQGSGADAFQRQQLLKKIASGVGAQLDNHLQ